MLIIDYVHKNKLLLIGNDYVIISNI